MEQLLSILSYLPFLTVIVGGSFLYLYAHKNDITQVVLSLAAEVFFYYLLDAQLVNPSADPEWVIIACTFIPSLSPFAMAFLICYIWKLYYEKPLAWHQYLWFVAPISIFSVSFMLYLVVGAEDAANFQSLLDRLRYFPDQYEFRNDIRLMYFFQRYSFYGAYVVYAIWTIGFAYMTMKRTGFNQRTMSAFLFKGASLPPIHILMLAIICLLSTIGLRIIVGRYFLFDHPWFNILIAIIQAFCVIQIVLATYCIDYVECTLRQVYLIDPKEDLDCEALEPVDTDEAEDHPAIALTSKEITESTDDEDETVDLDTEVEDIDAFRLVQERLEVGLHEMMTEKKAFLESELRLVDVARQLGTNRNYLSRHINEKYHMNFNEYLNRMRIEYSKDYMVRHPEQLLDTIAVECGFSTAQSFGRKFKAIEGMTPRSWLVALLKQQKK